MDMVLGVTTCCLSAAALCHLLGKMSDSEADYLRSVIRVNRLMDLPRLLEDARNVLPLVVAVSGRVGSDTPIDCEYSGLKGVIMEQKVEQHFLRKNDEGSWKQDSSLIFSKRREVPWYLDDGTGRAHVIGARNATGLVLTDGSERFEDSASLTLEKMLLTMFEESGVHGTLDYVQDVKMLRFKRIERVLPTGTPLTVVGEAVKDDDGTIRIQRPHGGPFYVSDKTVDQLIANLRMCSRFYKDASIVLSGFWAYPLAKNAYQYIMERRRHWEMRKRVIITSSSLFVLVVICAGVTCSSHLTDCPL